MRKHNEFFDEEEEGVADFEGIDEDVYGDDGIEEAIDEDRISPEEEGFMQGYNDSSVRKRRRLRDEED